MLPFRTNGRLFGKLLLVGRIHFVFSDITVNDAENNGNVAGPDVRRVGHCRNAKCSGCEDSAVRPGNDCTKHGRAVVDCTAKVDSVKTKLLTVELLIECKIKDHGDIYGGRAPDHQHRGKGAYENEGSAALDNLGQLLHNCIQDTRSGQESGKNECNEKNFADGRYWTYNTAKALSKLFPFWSVGQINRIVKKCEEHGLILTRTSNKKAMDKTRNFTITDFVKSIYRNRQMDLSESQKPFDETGKCYKEQLVTTVTNAVKQAEPFDCLNKELRKQAVLFVGEDNELMDALDGFCQMRSKRNSHSKPMKTDGKDCWQISG